MYRFDIHLSADFDYWIRCTHLISSLSSSNYWAAPKAAELWFPRFLPTRVAPIFNIHPFWWKLLISVFWLAGWLAVCVDKSKSRYPRKVQYGFKSYNLPLPGMGTVLHGSITAIKVLNNYLERLTLVLRLWLQMDVYLHCGRVSNRGR